MTREIHWLLAAILAVVLMGCRPQPRLIVPASAERPEPGVVIEEPQTPLIPFTLANPRSVQAEISLTFKNVAQLDGELLQRSNRSKGIPDDLPPNLFLWSPDPVEDLQQKQVSTRTNVPPDSFFNDYPNANRFLYWDLKPYLATSSTLELRRVVRYVSFDLKFEVNPALVGAYETDGYLFRVYTRSEELLEPTADLRALVNGLVAGIANPYEKAGKIYDWVADEAEKEALRAASRIAESPNPQASEDASHAFKFVNLCRIAGVPARTVCGFQINGAGGAFRTWAEFYLPNYGWLPADPGADGTARPRRLGRAFFGELPNDRLVLARGINLPIKPSLPWATYNNSDLQKDHVLLPKPFLIAVSGLRATTDFRFLVLESTQRQL
ncbi:MAG: transglutaminase-like domain-containing protein [bacterium]